MRIQFYLDHIVDSPHCAIAVNGGQLYMGSAQPYHEFDLDVPEGRLEILIRHLDKKPQDTKIENGKITRDRSFELTKIVIDGYDLEELIWNSEFRADNGQTYPSCLFFGPNGDFVLEAEYPILKWILKSRHEKNNNDPDWGQDYDFYTQACRILAQISQP